MAQRKQYSGEFKAKVVLQALKGQHTLDEIASKYSVHPVQVAKWKKQALDELPHVFADHRAREVRAVEEEKSRLYERVGRLKVELEWLKNLPEETVVDGEIVAFDESGRPSFNVLQNNPRSETALIF